MAIQSHKQKPKHPLPLWVRRFIVVAVFLLVISGTVIWIIQGANAIIPVAIFGALGVLFAFVQILPSLFPKEEHEGSSPSFSMQHKQPGTTHTLFPEASNKPGISSHADSVKEDWGEAPVLGLFAGRSQELALLKQWVVDDRCRVVAVLGMGGMGKTSTVVSLVNQVKSEFEYIIRSLGRLPDHHLRAYTQSIDLWYLLTNL